MADQQGQRQVNTGSTAPAGQSRDIRSDDARQSVEFIARQQVQQQAKINARRAPNQIGSVP